MRLTPYQDTMNKLFAKFISVSRITQMDLVTSIASFTGTNTETILVSDPVRGGTFNLYAGDNPADNGIIFTDGLLRKWRREGVDAVNINWFGGTTGGADNRQLLLDAIQSSKVNTGRVKIYIPETPTSVYYYVSDTIEINDAVEIFGDGYQSKIQFAIHKSGIKFTYPNSFYSYVHDISIEATDAVSGWDSTKHGIILKTPVRFSNVSVRFFDGCGFHAVNSYEIDPSLRGNSNTATFFSCKAYGNKLHGFFFKGGDANAMSAVNCDSSSNGGVGYYDQSFLGNHFSSNHAATNGSPEISWQRGLVKSGGTVYACIKDETVGIAPPNATYWQDIGATWHDDYPYVVNYNAGTTYYAVAGYILEGGNQYGTLLGNYCEGDQAPGYIDYGNIDFGSNIPIRNAGQRIYANLGVVRVSSFAADVEMTTPYIDITGNKLRLRTAKTPASATDTGVAGEICWDASYIYTCVATNTWKRIAIATW